MTETITHTLKSVASPTNQDPAQIYLDLLDRYFENDGAEDVKV